MKQNKRKLSRENFYFMIWLAVFIAFSSLYHLTPAGSSAESAFLLLSIASMVILSIFVVMWIVVKVVKLFRKFR